MLFGELITWYLFFGGVGGGTYLVWFCAAAIAQYRKGAWVSFGKTITRPMLIMSFALMAIGGLCLIRDLTLPGRVLLLFTRPTFSILTFGAFTLGAFLLCLGYLVIASFRNEGRAPSRIFKIVSIASVVLAFTAIVYTGVFLASLSAVPFWNTPLLPLLFTLSSCSTGIAVMILVALFTSSSAHLVTKKLDLFLRVDLVIILLELALLLVMCLLFINNPVTHLSLIELAKGQFFYEFWLGFIFCAIVAPLIMEVLAKIVRITNSAYYAYLGCFILIGGFFMRYCVINAGIHLSSLMFSSLGL